MVWNGSVGVWVSVESKVVENGRHHTNRSVNDNNFEHYCCAIGFVTVKVTVWEGRSSADSAAASAGSVGITIGAGEMSKVRMNDAWTAVAELPES